MPQVTKMDDAATWELIHKERASIADTLAELTRRPVDAASLCGGWTVRETAAHIVSVPSRPRRISWPAWRRTASGSTR